MISNKKMKSNWNKQDLVILLWIIHKYNLFKQKTVLEYVYQLYNLELKRLADYFNYDTF